VAPDPGTLSGIDESAFEELVTRTVEAGTWNVPTAYLWENFYTTEAPETLAQLPEMRYVPRAMVERWINQKRNMSAGQAEQGLDAADGRRIVEARRALLRALDRGRARFLFGTDSPQMFNVPGFSLHREIETLTAAGLSPYRILESATRSIAEYVAEDLDLDADFGTVAVGQHADLLLLDSNPLADAARVAERAGVMVRGHWFPAAEIDGWLADLAAQNGG
jgi:imidazolonepropionase-like amidohydrolase